MSRTAYGRIVLGPFPTPGAYADTIIATVAMRAGSFSNVTTTIQATCTIAATNLAFGNDVGTVLKANATIAVRYTNTTSCNVGLGAGTATGATVTTRKMKSGANLLNYALFSNPGRTGSGNALAPLRVSHRSGQHRRLRP